PQPTRNAAARLVFMREPLKSSPILLHAAPHQAKNDHPRWPATPRCPGVCLLGTAAALEALFVTQSHHRIDPRGPPGAYCARRERDSSHHHDCHTERDRIVWCNSVEKACQQTAHDNCRRDTKSEAGQSERYPFAQDETG